MSRRRFYAPPEAFAHDGASVALSEDETRHLRDVLRLRAGDEAFVFDGEGREFACVVVEAGGRERRAPRAMLEVRAPVEPPSSESTLSLTLAIALLKGEKFDLVVQKATELGVARIVPLETKRSDVQLRDARDAARKAERWRRLTLEAAKQSGRARIPSIEMPASFESFVSSESESFAGFESESFAGSAATARSLRVLFAERDGESLSALRGVEGAQAASEASALVGPEGGWDEDEITLARERGWTIVTLGGRTLRAETAGIVVCALLQNLFGDLG